MVDSLFSFSSLPPLESLPVLLLPLLSLLLFLFLFRFLSRISSSSSLFPFSSTLSSPISITKLFIYPIHSCSGIELSSTNLTPNGFQYDHQFAVINSLNEILTLRSRPKLITIIPSFNDSMNKLILSAPNNLSIEFSLQEETSIASTSAVGGGQAGATSSKTKQRLRCRLFDHIMDGYEVDPSVSEWFCQVLGDKNLKFVRYTSKFIQNEAKGTKLLKSFKEFPYFMISEETIQDFHQHLLTLPSSSSLSSSSAGMSFDLLIQRFRPNIVVKGCKSYDEDQWDGIVTPNGAVLSVVRLCDHCSMPNVHPIKGTMDTSLIISRVLKSYRTGKHLQLKSEFEKKVFLGVRLENDSTGMMTGGLGVLGALTGSRSRNEVDGVMLGSLSVGDKLDILH